MSKKIKMLQMIELLIAREFAMFALVILCSSHSGVCQKNKKEKEN